MAAPQTASRRYVAFISYSHVDRDVARWLHRALEAYRVLPHLRTSINCRTKSGRLSLRSSIARNCPRRPIWPNRRIALDASDALIVVCSPTAARSRWVTEEVRRFKELGRIASLVRSARPARG
jgi:hypothetical protein